MAANSKDWIPIAEQASKEMNPAKLMTLVKQLCSALDDSKKAAALDRPDLTGQTKHADQLNTSSAGA
jgi:hypothetical protein